ncbi:MAG: DMT family transporter [Alphaproteobacteria bacterium]|nr:DMT family transporter [Alphaproteobacteria bacterium]
MIPARVLHLGMLFTVGISYSLLFSINKLAAETGLPYVAYVFWHSLGGGLMLLVVCLSMGRHAWPRLGWLHLRTYLVWGGLGIAAPITLLTYVAPNLPAAVMTMILVLVPLFTYLFALLLRMESFRILSVLALAVGLGGVLLVIVPGASLPDAEAAGWVLLALLAPACFSLVTVFAGKFRPPDAPSATLACGLLLGSALLLVPVMFGTGQLYVFPGPSLEGDLTLLYASALSVVTFYVFLEMVRVAGPVFATQHNYIAVLAGFGWGLLLFGEAHSAYIWGATALMFAGLAMHTLSARRAARAAAE